MLPQTKATAKEGGGGHWPSKIKRGEIGGQKGEPNERTLTESQKPPPSPYLPPSMQTKKRREGEGERDSLSFLLLFFLLSFPTSIRDPISRHQKRRKGEERRENEGSLNVWSGGEGWELFLFSIAFLPCFSPLADGSLLLFYQTCFFSPLAIEYVRIPRHTPQHNKKEASQKKKWDTMKMIYFKALYMHCNWSILCPFRLDSHLLAFNLSKVALWSWLPRLDRPTDPLTD